MKKGAWAAESLPNNEQWVALYGLTLDGCNFTRTRIMQSKFSSIIRKGIAAARRAAGYPDEPKLPTRKDYSKISYGATEEGVTAAVSGEGHSWEAKADGADMFGSGSSSSSSSDDSEDEILE
jgi:hypothetical protein